MNNKPIIIVAGEPYSVFLEIFFKTLKTKEVKLIKSPIIIIASKENLVKQMKKLKFSFKIKTINKELLNIKSINNNSINLIDVKFNFNKVFDKISKKSNSYISECFKLGLNLMKKNKAKGLLNGPISKKHFLNSKFPGITEYLASKTNKRGKEVMLIYNKNLSVSTVTTHLPLKNIFKEITKSKIMKNITTVNNFYKKVLNKKPKIAVCGLNPHCESGKKNNEEKKIIIPAINLLKKINLYIDGPFPADTFFLKKNINKYDVVVGMYHDQVLTPLKTLYNFNAINITLGLPFIRISPDHGPNKAMLGKNISDPSSIFYAMNFINKIG